jgi:hypothetical protein
MAPSLHSARTRCDDPQRRGARRVRRAGRGIFAIAEGLTRDGIPCPSMNDPARNRHRTGCAWAKGAIGVILGNPRYTGRQVWNKQRKDEVLIDVEDVALGHETEMRWNPRDKWVFSDNVVHTDIVSVDTFRQAREIAAAKGAGRTTRERTRTQHRYVLRGLPSRHQVPGSSPDPSCSAAARRRRPADIPHLTTGGAT